MDLGGNGMNHYDIEACVKAAKTGNKEELTRILEQFKPFIIKTAKDFNIRCCDIHDLMQIGYMAIINAVEKYRVGSNTFSSYAFTSIKNAFRHTARQHSKYNTELSFYNRTCIEDNEGSELINSLAAIENLEDRIVSNEKARELKRVVSKLPEAEAELVIMIYYNGVSLRNYADRKGISYQQALRKRDYILMKLNNFLKNKPVN
jgi:RNA polymerase sporulation-specific sigma factor